MSFLDLSKPEGLKAFDDYIASKLVIQGYIATTLDVQAFLLMGKAPPSQYTHALRFYNYMSSFSEAQRKQFRQGGEVPAQLQGPIKAPAVAAAAPSPAEKKGDKAEAKADNKGKADKKADKKAAEAPKPAAATAPASSANLAELEEAVKNQADLVRKLKAEKADKAKVEAEVAKLLALKKQLTDAGGSLPAPGTAPPAKEEPKKEEPKKEEAKKDKKGEGKKDEAKKEEPKKEEPKKEEAKKEQPKEDKKGKDKKGKGDKSPAAGPSAPATTPAPAGFDQKLVKAVEKEGGKKGQDILGVYEMGGLEFFCTSVDTPEGNLELMNICLDAMNQEVDPNAEEKRGGAATVGKMIFSAGTDQLGIIARVPADKVTKINTGEWLAYVVEKIKGKVVGKSTAEFAQAVVLADKDKGRFPLKMKEEAIAFAVEFLKNKGCFPDKDDSDSDVCYGDDDFDM